MLLSFEIATTSAITQSQIIPSMLSILQHLALIGHSSFLPASSAEANFTNFLPKNYNLTFVVLETHFFNIFK